MLAVLANHTYGKLFFAQLIALVGTGLATIALGLLAYEIAGGNAGAVLGTALAIKMVAYIGIAPIVGAYADRLPRKTLLVTMDAIRGFVALALPFVDQVWQIYVLIFALQSASAAFTPTFQAAIPDVLPEERDYTRALSLSRLAYDMESLLSPMLAAALLTVIGFHWLFAGTAVGFAISAVMVLSVTLPVAKVGSAAAAGVWRRTSRGMRIYLKTPRLIGLLAITLAAAAASAMVIVNTVVIVKELGFGQTEVALALAAYGGGSMLAALVLPRLLDRVSDRPVMLAGGVALMLALGGLAALTWIFGDSAAYWPLLLGGWVLLGMGYAATVTPSGRLLRRSSRDDDRTALFAAQFALSHVSWLIAYPLAGQIGARIDMATAFVVLCGLAAIGVGLAFAFWPREDREQLPHSHDDLPEDHPHLLEHANGGHIFVIDDLHTSWPGKV